MTKSLYGGRFYQRRKEQKRYAAETMLGLLKGILPQIESVADVGCGVGVWLSVARGMGANDVVGFDGPWVDRGLLEIPATQFREANLGEPPKPERRFDLAISLEVAEHIDHTQAGRFIDFLTGLSDFILFSAAIPGQGGTGHVNEQWPGYWAGLFKERGYSALDVIRSTLWWDEAIPYWYRQNALLYVKTDKLSTLKDGAVVTRVETPIAAIHPEHHERARLGKVRWALRSWARGILGRASLASKAP